MRILILCAALAIPAVTLGQLPQDADVNRDGYVSPAEADHAAALRVQFDDLDRNRDGRLDPTETTGLAPAPPGAVPALPTSALGRAPGTVTSGSGTAGATPATSGVRGTAGAHGGTTTTWNPASGAASGSPYGSPFDSPYTTTPGMR